MTASDESLGNKLDRVLVAVGTLIENSAELKQGQSAIEIRLTSVEQGLARNTTAVITGNAGLRSDINRLRTDMNNMRAELKEELLALDNKIDQHITQPHQSD